MGGAEFRIAADMTLGQVIAEINFCRILEKFVITDHIQVSFKSGDIIHRWYQPAAKLG